MYRSDTAVEVPWTNRRFWAGARRSVPVNVWLLGLTSLLTDVSAEMVVSVLPAYLIIGLQLSPLTYGALDGLYHGATVVTRWVSGVVADRRGRYKQVALLGYALSAMCRPGLVLAGAAPAAIAAVIATDRLGKGIRTAPRDALISLSTPPQALAESFGVHRSLDTFGALLGPLVALWILSRVPGAFDVVFVTSFAIAIVGVGVLAAFVRDVADPAGAPAGPSSSLAESFAVFGLPDVRRLAVAAAAVGLLTASDGLFYVALQQGIDFPSHWIPMLFAGTSAVFLLLSVPMGMLADRAGRTRVFVLGHVVLLAAYAVLLAPLPGRMLPLLLVVCLGAYYAATDGVLMALASTAVPAENRGSGLAIVATASSLARVLAAIGFGFIWTMWSRETAVVVFALALAGAMVIAARLLRSLDGAPR